MSNAPVYEIDLPQFSTDPYPDLKRMRAEAPIAYVPQLDATLITTRDDIFINEKKTDIFSSDQPDGLMTKLMGANMMRKDGEAHLNERKAIFPTVSPKTVKTIWQKQFKTIVDETLNDILPNGQADMINEIAMRISGDALKAITGLTQISWQEMDRVSQGMIDGCANYSSDPEITKRCNDCTSAIDQYIDERIPDLTANPDHSLLSVQLQAGLNEAQYRANIKLAISGGQNEPRDAIAGLVWALLTHPEQLANIKDGNASWLDAFEEYARWISPIGMSPRRIAKRYELNGVTLEQNDRVFFMFGSANRDETVFSNPDEFDLGQNIKATIPFGAGPHFCAGAWASRSLIADVALPQIFACLPNLALVGETIFHGWAFRGPTQMSVKWNG
jgi:cytochrome P450